MPVPMIAPRPSAERSSRPTERSSWCSPSSVSATSASTGLVANRPLRRASRVVLMPTRGGLMTRTGRRERSISRAGDGAEHPPRDRAAARRADDDQVRLLLLGEHEHAADDRARAGARRGVDARAPRSGRRRSRGRLLGASATASERGIVDSASSSIPSMLRTATSAPISSAMSAAASASQGWSAPAFAATTMRFMPRALSASPRGETHEAPTGGEAVPSGTFHTVDRLCLRSSSMPSIRPPPTSRRRSTASRRRSRRGRAA